MGYPPITQTWTFSLNNTHTWVSAIDATEALMFALVGTGGFLPSTMGYTCKGSCDGTTGAMDGTNRITSASKWGTRFNGSGGAQSWIVFTDGAGIDWCFSYNSSNDDRCRLAHSPGGNYVAAGTPTQQPTATDECFDSASGTWIGTDTSHNRAFNFWGSSDKKMFRFGIFFNGQYGSFLKGEKFTSAIVSPVTFSLAVGGGTQGAIKSYYNGNNTNTVVNYSYGNGTATDLCRVHANGQDINAQASKGGVMPGGGAGSCAGSETGFNSDTPSLQGGSSELLFPSSLASKTSNADGKLGTIIDEWYTIGINNSTPTLGDTYDSLLYFVVSPGGGIIVPWDGSTTPNVSP